jgi:hypothetical protein
MIELKEYIKSNKWIFALGISNPNDYFETGRFKTNYCLLQFAIFNHSWWFKVPEIFRPEIEWIDTSKASWTRGSASGYWKHIMREYKISITRESIRIAYGIQPGFRLLSDKKNSDHIIMFSMPWLKS